MRRYTGYRNKFANLLEECRRQGMKVRFFPKGSLDGYVGMNPGAAKAIGLRMSPHEFLIEKGLTWKENYVTLRHEMREYGLMKRGWKLYPAHRKALREERLG